MKLDDLKFEPHRVSPSGKWARVEFANGYGASVISGPLFYTDGDNPYEVAVLHDGSLCYDTPITDHVIGHCNAEKVNSLLAEIEALPVQPERSEK
jgi:hypothetical protein